MASAAVWTGMLALALVAGCQQTGGVATETANPITGGEIAASSLDAPAEGQPVAGEPAEGGPLAEGDVPAPSAEALASTAPATIQPPAARRTRLVDRDVEAPEVFDVRDTALWDGRPSLGGVWVASPDAADPERVIMRNPANGQFVIGALFRRERDNPGPALQISSDAAAALGILAGQPAEIAVTALRRDEGRAEAPAAEAPVLDTAEVVTGELPQAEPPEREPEATAPTPPATAAPAPAPTGDVRVQVGIFADRGNADRAAAALQQAGIAATVREEASTGRTIWSVIANGPAPRAAFVDKVRAAGFADAYALSG